MLNMEKEITVTLPLEEYKRLTDLEHAFSVALETNQMIEVWQTFGYGKSVTCYAFLTDTESTELIKKQFNQMLNEIEQLKDVLHSEQSKKWYQKLFK